MMYGRMSRPAWPCRLFHPWPCIEESVPVLGDDTCCSLDNCEATMPRAGTRTLSTRKATPAKGPATGARCPSCGGRSPTGSVMSTKQDRDRGRILCPQGPVCILCPVCDLGTCRCMSLPPFRYAQHLGLTALGKQRSNGIPQIAEEAAHYCPTRLLQSVSAPTGRGE